VPVPIFAMMVMPDTDEQVTDFFWRLTLTHTMRWHAHYQRVASESRTLRFRS
jgi:hypothetical protein